MKCWENSVYQLDLTMKLKDTCGHHFKFESAKKSLWRKYAYERRFKTTSLVLSASLNITKCSVAMSKFKAM